MPSPKTQTKPQIKCLFMGLDNGGKTSILYTLKNKFPHIIKLKPTKRIERTDFYVLGLPVKIWDMGGQKKYRKEYLARNQYFDGAKIAIYVIDVTDPSKFSETIEYFEKILDIFELLNTDPRILIFLHKSDPDVKENSQLQKSKRLLKNEISNLPHALDVVIHETSILDADHLNNLIVQEFLALLPSGRKIQDELSEFMLNINASAATLIDEHILTIANAYRDEDSRQILQICGPHFASLVEKLRAGSYAIPEKIEIEMGGNVFYQFVEYDNTGFYLIIYTKTSESTTLINYELPKFTENLFTHMEYII